MQQNLPSDQHQNAVRHTNCPAYVVWRVTLPDLPFLPFVPFFTRTNAKLSAQWLVYCNPYGPVDLTNFGPALRSSLLSPRAPIPSLRTAKLKLATYCRLVIGSNTGGTKCVADPQARQWHKRLSGSQDYSFGSESCSP